MNISPHLAGKQQQKLLSFVTSSEHLQSMQQQVESTSLGGAVVLDLTDPRGSSMFNKLIKFIILIINDFLF